MEKTGIIVLMVILILIYIYPAVGMFKYRKEEWPQKHKFLWFLVGFGLFQMLIVMIVILTMALLGHEFHGPTLIIIIIVSEILMSISHEQFIIVREDYKKRKIEAKREMLEQQNGA